MKKMILASTSTIHGEEFLEYLFQEKNLFVGCKNILFIPFQDHLSHLAYTKKVQDQFKVNLSVVDYSKDNDFLQKLNKCDEYWRRKHFYFFTSLKIKINRKDQRKILSGTPTLEQVLGQIFVEYNRHNKRYAYSRN